MSRYPPNSLISAASRPRENTQERLPARLPGASRFDIAKRIFGDFQTVAGKAPHGHVQAFTRRDQVGSQRTQLLRIGNAKDWFRLLFTHGINGVTNCRVLWQL